MSGGVGEGTDQVSRTAESQKWRSAVFSFRALPGQEAAALAWTQRMVGVARGHEGNLASTVVGPDGVGQYDVVHHFRDEAALQSWLDSTERATVLAAANGVLEAIPAVRRTGLETWFLPQASGAAMVPPARWKMWLVSLLAIYPLVLMFLTWVSPHIKSWPIALRAAALPLVVLTLMTFVVMPTLTRLLGDRMARGSRITRRARPASRVG